MKNEIDIGISFPTAELNVDTTLAEPENSTVEYDTKNVKYEDVAETDSNQLLVEGVTELEDHPQLETFLRSLNDLKNDFILKVGGLSNNFELNGSVKLLFTVSKK